MNFTKRSLEILKSFRSKQNIQSVADIFDTTYDIIRNNYFKHFWRAGYLIRIGYGYYIISEKGKEKIKYIETLYKIDNLILTEAKKGTCNKEIVDVLLLKYNKSSSYPALYSKIFKFKKKFKLLDRRKVECDLPKDFSIELAELIGLIFSDGCINKYGISFYNKDTALLDRFRYLVFEVFNLDTPSKRERRSKFFEINYYSMDMARLLLKLTQHKSLIPEQILYGNEDIKTSFLRGYFSGDGCIALSISHRKFYRKFQIKSFLFLACKRMNITRSIALILESLGYKVSTRWNGLMIHGLQYIFKYYNEIGFINKSKIADYSRHWSGFEKNQILKYVATSMRNDSKLNNLRTGKREGVVKYIQNRLEELKAKIY